eukprot:Em0005g638a
MLYLFVVFSSELKYEVASVIDIHNSFEHSSPSSPPVPPGLPLVTVRPMGNGLVVSCTPGANGDPPTSYDITVEPNGTHIITASNGMVEQNIPGLLPNTTYTVRVIAINCAGSSGVVTVTATTG